METSITTKEILSRGLSLDPSAEETTTADNIDKSSQALLLEPEIYHWPTATFQKIGFGQCGLVFTVPDRPHVVVKIARPYFGESLYADFLAQQRVEQAFARRSDAVRRHGVQLPGVYYFLPKPTTTGASSGDAQLAESLVPQNQHEGTSQARDKKMKPHTTPLSAKEWWASNISLFTSSTASGPGTGLGSSRYSTFHLPSEALFTEHIPPLSKPIREALIELYCSPASKQESVRADPANKDCLLRVYLGRRRAVDERTGQPKVVTNFALRNYNLHLDQMLELGLDVHHFAEMMATALADVHWGAGVDAFDVEFVLGGRRTGHDNDMDRAADLWLLDFNLCSRFGLDELVDNEYKLEGLVNQLVHVFFANDPYYPRPRTRDEKECNEEDVSLWETFAGAYSGRADEILQSRDRLGYDELIYLPGRFITGCVEMQKTLPPGVDKIGVD